MPKRQTIAVLDDSPVFLSTLKEQLELANYSVLANSSPKKFTQVIKGIKAGEKSVDGIILDYYLGNGICGIDVANEIRENKIDIPILIYSGVFLNQNQQKHISDLTDQNVIQGFVEKTVGERNLLKIISETINDYKKNKDEPLLTIKRNDLIQNINQATLYNILCYYLDPYNQHGEFDAKDINSISKTITDRFQNGERILYDVIQNLKIHGLLIPRIPESGIISITNSREFLDFIIWNTPKTIIPLFEKIDNDMLAKENLKPPTKRHYRSVSNYVFDLKRYAFLRREERAVYDNKLEEYTKIKNNMFALSVGLSNISYMTGRIKKIDSIAEKIAIRIASNETKRGLYDKRKEMDEKIMTEILNYSASNDVLGLRVIAQTEEQIPDLIKSFKDVLGSIRNYSIPRVETNHRNVLGKDSMSRFFLGIDGLSDQIEIQFTSAYYNLFWEFTSENNHQRYELQKYNQSDNFKPYIRKKYESRRDELIKLFLPKIGIL
jgi:CheY-like chemotaxis protein